MNTRRNFLKAAGACTALGNFGFLSELPVVGAQDAKIPAGGVQLHPEIEPLVRLLEETPRDAVIEAVAKKIRSGVTYREILAALFLAGVRNVQPRPVGFKFHAVLVVNSAHLASLDSADSDRWLPILWAIDKFKDSQAADVREGDWTLGRVDESAVPKSHLAREALIRAMENWDEAAADAAIVGMARSAPAHEIFDLLCRYGVRDFREIGHKEIYVANSFRTLEAIGWHHAEPVLRSLVYALLDRDGERANPSQADLLPDRPYRKNLETAKTIREDWLDGTPDASATKILLTALRSGGPDDASKASIELLNRGVSPHSIFEACFAASAEWLIRRPGILSLHATTFTNATHYAFQHCGDQETRKMLLLQNVSFLPLFRPDKPDNDLRLESLFQNGAERTPANVDDIFATLDRDRLVAARMSLRHLQDSDARSFAAAARRLIFLKGTDSHDYKFSSAVLEDYHSISPEWRNPILAASVYYLRGSDQPDNPLVAQVRAAFQG